MNELMNWNTLRYISWGDSGRIIDYTVHQTILAKN